MLTSIILLIVSAFLFLVGQLFSLVSLAIPDGIQTAFNTFFSYVHIFDGFFPITDFLLALIFLITLETGLYLVRIFLFGFSLIPWFGSHQQLPMQSNDYEGMSNVVNLNKGRGRVMRPSGGRMMVDIDGVRRRRR